MCSTFQKFAIGRMRRMIVASKGEWITAIYSSENGVLVVLQLSCANNIQRFNLL